MYDVAKAAGVSQTTVSFVVNDVVDANISQETRERVWAAVKALGWRPNAMARSLSLRRSQTIGLISDEVATSPHAGQIIQGAQDAAWAQTKMLLVVNTGSNPELEHAAVEMLLERQVEGLIYATMYHRPVQPSPLYAQLPTVLLDCFSPDRALTSVVPDGEQGGYDATLYLIQRGHRRIGFVNNDGPIPATLGRMEGYRKALAEAGISFDPQLIRTGLGVAAEGYRSTLDLLQQAERPTALFCFNDSMAMGAYDAIKQLGLTIPGDVAVIGFDNLELIATQLNP
ncbi:MAG TPA: LacI family DNA-binding transcriptional regulator, partial [Herpetosiphonaceae bacterium]